ncbi:MAG: fumarylacetoacetate hydrolase family protein [Armatimonadetes bacterium]|nr:fumarylacetoacetate hydrolase family protein [Armatimonadota bacterium]
MKLVRFQTSGNVSLGALVDDNTVVDFSAADPTLPTSMKALLALGPAGLQKAVAAITNAPDSAKIPLSSVQLLAPVGDAQKILCIGQNYRDHCIEQNQPIPESAILFSKYPTALNDPDGVVRIPKLAKQVDYEAELAVVIGGAGGGGRYIPVEEALNHVAGYMCANDVSARDIQFADKQWVRGKSPDGFYPTGPYLLTADEVADPHDLDISLTLNGQTMQTSNTSNLIFNVPFLISYLSQTMTLLPGDILSTGTPGGVGIFRKPPILLKQGDTMSVTIAGLGTLTNTVEED